jgi:hypothetical protein
MMGAAMREDNIAQYPGYLLGMMGSMAGCSGMFVKLITRLYHTYTSAAGGFLPRELSQFPGEHKCRTQMNS